MPAKALARVEEEIVDRIAREARRRQRVVELLFAEQAQHGPYEGGVAAGPLAQASRELGERGLRSGGSRRLAFLSASPSPRPPGIAGTSARRTGAPR